MEKNITAIEPRTMAAGRGASWIFDALGYFTQSWLAWSGLAVLLIIFSVLFSMIPFAEILLQLFSPVVIAGLMLGCRQQDEDKSFNITFLLAGFNDSPGQLILIGAAYLLASIIIMIPLAIYVIITFGGIDAIAQLQTADPDMLLKHAVNLLVAVIIGMLLYMPVLMALWFAPAIVVFQQVRALDAMLLSFKACLANTLPFLVYGLVIVVFGIIASIPLFLGWLVLIPVIIVSVYLAYKDIFISNPQ